MCLCMCVHIDVFRVQKRAINHWELELQAAVRHTTWLLGIETGTLASGAAKPAAQLADAVLTSSPKGFYGSPMQVKHSTQLKCVGTV